MGIRLWGVLCALLFMWSSEGAWARCAECPIPLAEMSGPWIVSGTDGGDMLFVIDRPLSHQKPYDALGVRMFVNESCSPRGVGSIKQIFGSSALLIELRDADGFISQKLAYVRKDGTAYIIAVPCAEGQACIREEVNREVSFRRLSGSAASTNQCLAQNL